jgi:hypothetical protein
MTWEWGWGSARCGSSSLTFSTFYIHKTGLIFHFARHPTPSHCNFIKIFLLAVNKKRFRESLLGKNKFNRDRTCPHNTLLKRIFPHLLGNREGIGYKVIYEEMREY